jgi:Tol biopolymer transport system component
MAARVVEARSVTGRSSAVEGADDRTRRAQWGFAGVTLLFAFWLIGAVLAAVGAGRHQLGQAAFQQAVDIFNLGVTALAVVCLLVVVRAIRLRRAWRRAFPVGYGVLGAGLVVLLASEVADLGWREGVVDPEGIAGLLAPTRVLLVIGLVLVACGPLRAALRSADAPRWPAVVSAALVLVATLLPGGFSPATNPWLERAPIGDAGELWLMNSDGSRQTRLIFADGRDGPSNAAFSPDGTRIAYTQVHFGDRSPLDDDYDIWVADADGTHSRPLVQGTGFQWLPHWSPDSEWIVYTDEPTGGPWMASGPADPGGGGLIGPGFLFGGSAQVRQYAHVWKMRADGTGSPEQITTGDADDRAATYSPDGTKLAFDSTRDGPTRVYVMDADGRNPGRLSGGADDWGATWSPDGKWLAYNSWPGGLEAGSQIWLVGADGLLPHQLTDSPAPLREPSWSPDGSRIAFIVVEGDRQSIWSIAASGGDALNLSNDSRGSGELTSGGGAWGMDGRIVFTHSEDPPAIAHALVREDLAVAAILLAALLLALVAVVTVRITPPFGAFAAIIGISTLAFAVIGEHHPDQWHFVPTAVAGGLIVDLLVRISSERWKAIAAGSGSAAALVVAAALTVALTAGLAWSPTLLAGVVVAAGALGLLLAEVVGPGVRPAGWAG